MATGVYNGFSGVFRDSQGHKQMELVDKGILPPPTKCYLCGQTEGRVLYHLEDYNDIMNIDTPMCFHCHMVLHCCRSGTDTYRGQARKNYWELYKQACSNGYCKRLYNVQDLFKAIDEGRIL